MVRLLVLLLLVVAFCVGAAIGYFNQASVTFHYLAGEVQLPLIALLFLAFLTGVGVAWLLTMARMYLVLRDHRRQLQQIRDLEAELKSLRNLPLAAANPPAKNA